MNIYVGNLSYSATEDGLKEIFGAHGEVTSVRIVKDRDTGNSKGFAFVEMADDNSARTAISNLDGKDYLQRPLRVNEARPRPERPERRPGGGGGDRGGFRKPRRFEN